MYAAECVVASSLSAVIALPVHWVVVVCFIFVLADNNHRDDVVGIQNCIVRHAAPQINVTVSETPATVTV